MQHCIITWYVAWHICGPCITHMWTMYDPYVTHMWPICDHVWPICDPYVTYSGWWLSHAVHHDMTIYERMSKNALRLSILIGKRTKRNGTACARQFHEKNRIWPICDSSFLYSHHTTLRMTMYLVFEKMPFFVVSSTISWGNCEIYCLHHVPCHLALSRPVLVVFCVLWVTCDILQMYTWWGYVVYYWNHPLTLHTFSNALKFRTFSVNSRSCKRKPIS